MFDAILSGCIPIVLSHDFVWPLSTEWDATSPFAFHPLDFSLRFDSNDFGEKLTIGRCLPAGKNASKPKSLDATLERIDASEIARLRRGLKTVRDGFFWYRFDESLPDNPLREGILPDGGLAHAFVRALEERAGGVKWQNCETELKQKKHNELVNRFQC